MTLVGGTLPAALGAVLESWGWLPSVPAMSLQYMEFRKQQDLDNILSWQPPEVSLGSPHPRTPLPPSPVAAGVQPAGRVEQPLPLVGDPAVRHRGAEWL